MKVGHDKFHAWVAMIVVCANVLLSGCGVESETPNPTPPVTNGIEDVAVHPKGTADVDAEKEDTIMLAITEIPKSLNNPSRIRVALLVNSNICDKVRMISSLNSRRKYVDIYTNVVSNLEFPLDVDLSDKEASRTVWINLEIYAVLVEQGASMLCELESMKPEIWDFLLDPPNRYRKALDLRTHRLKTAAIAPRRFRTDALFNELRDGLFICSRRIEKCWYPIAKEKMSSSQLMLVRQKVKNVLGELPQGMAGEDRE